MLNNHNNPWLGLASYEYEDAYRFFGREKEMAGLKDSVCNNLTTTIYGISGAGKTSLINAGMCPLLEADGYLPVRIRLVHGGDKTYSEQIIKAISDAVVKANGEIETVDGLNAKTTDDNGQKMDVVPESEKLWMFFHTSVFWSETNHHISPVIFIDQFEEIFTQNNKTDVIQDFFDSINALQYDVPPTVMAQLLEKQDNYIDLNEDKDFRLVFIMREDFLARLEDYAYDVPALRKNRIGIKRMNGMQALDVILRPMPEIVNREVALGIISKVSGRLVRDNEAFLENLSIDTSILSLFCSELYYKAAELKKDCITLELIEQFGSNILSSFYENTMKLVSTRTMEYLEAHLLTRSGFRNTVALEDVLENGIKRTELNYLSNKRLIRIETSEGTERMEFTHDVLCSIAKEHRDKRQAKTGKKSSIYRNIGYIFDTSLTLLCIMLISFNGYTSQILPKMLHFYKVETIFTAIAFLAMLLIGYCILPYRFTKDRNASWVSALAFIGNIFIFFTLILTDALDSTAYLTNALLLIWCLYPLLHIFNSLRFNKKRSIGKALDYIVLQKVYRDYSSLITILKYEILIFITFVAFLIGLTLNVTYSIFAIPLFGITCFTIIGSLNGLTRLFNWQSAVTYLIQIVLLIIIVLSQFWFGHLWWMLSCWILLLTTVYFFVNSRQNNDTLLQKCKRTGILWSIAFFIIPLLSMGYNVFSLPDYVRTQNGVINNYQTVRFMIVKDKDGHRGVRDRNNLVIPVLFDSIDKSVYANVDFENSSGLSSYENDYFTYSSDCEITFHTTINGKKEEWNCSDHLDMDNICTDLITPTMESSSTYNHQIKYIRYLLAQNNSEVNSEIHERILEGFVSNLISDTHSQYMKAEVGSKTEDYYLKLRNHIDEKGIKYLELLKNGKDSISYSTYKSAISASLGLLSMDPDGTTSKLLLDTIYPKCKNIDDSCGYYIGLSFFKLFSREFVESEKASLAALRLDSTRMILYTNLFSALYFQKRYDEAFKLLEKYKDVNYEDYGYIKHVGYGICEDFRKYVAYGIYNDTTSQEYLKLKQSLIEYWNYPDYDFGYYLDNSIIKMQKGFGDDIEYWFFTNKDKKLLTPPVDWYNRHMDEGDSIYFYRTLDTQKRGFFMHNGTMSRTIEAKYDHAWLFSEGLAAVEKDGKLGFINKEGRYAIEPIFDYHLEEASAGDVVDFVFHDGYCPMVAAPGKHGLINKKGEWVVEPDYSYINNPVNGYRIVRKGKKYGIMDSQLRLVLPIEYSWINQDQENNTIQIEYREYSYSEFQKLAKTRNRIK